MRHFVSAVRCGLLAGSLAITTTHARAAPYWITGEIVDVTSTPSGLMLRLAGSQVPDNCVSPPGSWMIVSSADPVMVSLVMSYWLSAKRGFTFYTSSTSGTFCQINQADPID